MSVELATVQVDLSSATLDELVEQAIIEHRLVESHLNATLAHYLRLGSVLLEARGRLAAEAWKPWLDGVGIGQTLSVHAMRLAHYGALLPAEAFEPYHDARGYLQNPSAARAISYLRGLPALTPQGGGKKFSKYSQEIRDEALHLRSAGLPYKQIGPMLGVSWSTVANWCDETGTRTSYKKHNAKKQAARHEMRAARKALATQREREERDRLARVTGGELATTYSLIRRALATISKVGASDVERKLLQAEEELVTLMRAQP